MKPITNPNSFQIEDYIGIFKNVVSKEYCEKVIKWFEYNKTTGNTTDRQKHEKAKQLYKDSELFFIENTSDITDLTVLETNFKILQEYNTAVFKCYDKYKNKYGALDGIGHHKLSPSVKIQKYQSSQGYHVWHCDNTSPTSCRRIIVCMLYLNDVEEGGETEFLYQSKRIKPQQGTMMLFPTAWTHTHRGNPPLKGTKYIVNAWLEFM